MYRCTECGSEFEIKPDFCNCGNDEFIFVEEEKKEEKAQQQAELAAKLNKIEQTQENIKPEIKETVQKIQYTTQRFAKPQIDMPSLVIFLTCIILSLIVIYCCPFPSAK